MITKMTGLILAAASVPVGSLAGANLLAINALNESTPTTIGAMVICTVFIGGLLWNAGRAFQNVTGCLKQLQKDSTETKAEVKEIKDDQAAMNRRVMHIEESCPEVGNCGKKHCK